MHIQEIIVSYLLLSLNLYSYTHVTETISFEATLTFDHNYYYSFLEYHSCIMPCGNNVNLFVVTHTIISLLLLQPFSPWFVYILYPTATFLTSDDGAKETEKTK